METREMRALVCEQTVGIEGIAVRQLRDPEPGACHVRINVAAAGVNFADLLMLEGRYQERPALPFVPGLEIAGTIDKVGAGRQKTPHYLQPPGMTLRGR